MATLQIQIDDALKRDADSLFLSLGFDTSTAVRIFLNAAVQCDGIPFPVMRDSLRQAVEDTRKRRNLFGPFDSAEEAVASMLED
ncbi:MAG: type II toxin-antitoxin system RelB/DinJ family antitoxin [Oscillospiraceae bacterium]|nr:type II toxin-antitoxin system RelB/DinJ family antitoxin [Oscillospiraceae bacterium]